MNLALVCQGLVKLTKGGVALQFKMDVVGCRVRVCRPDVLKHHQYQLNLMKCRLSVLIWILFMGDCTALM